METQNDKNTREVIMFMPAADSGLQFYWPDAITPRPGQVEMIGGAINAYHKEGKLGVIYDLPPGYGKTIMAYAVSTARTRTGTRLFRRTGYFTHQNSLVRQVAGDPFIPTSVKASLMGRANYRCAVNKTLSCAEATCRIGRCYKESKSDTEKKRDCPGVASCPDRQCACRQCTYERAKTAATLGEFVISNMSMFIVSEKVLRDFDLIVVDEAQGMDGALMNHLTVSITDKHIDLPNWTSEVRDVNKDVVRLCNTGKYEEGVGALDEQFAEAVKWLETTAKSAVAEMLREQKERVLELESSRVDVESVTEQLTDKGVVMAEVENEIDKIRSAKAAETRDEMRVLYEYETMRSKIDSVLSDWRTQKEPWIVDSWESKRDDSTHLAFKPTGGAGRFIQRLIGGRGDKILIMSATPPSPMEMGYKDNGHFVRFHRGSLFPKERRQIYYRPTASMTKKNRSASSYEKIAIEILHLQSVGKTIVHCHSQEIAVGIGNALSNIGCDHVMQPIGGGRMKSLEGWKKNTNVNVFLSFRMEEGLDLPDELGRVNIIAKVPWPYLGDIGVATRRAMPGGEFWYLKTAMDTIQQASGRTTRGASDWSNTYILDSNFAYIMSKAKKEGEAGRQVVKEWFSEVLVSGS